MPNEFQPNKNNRVFSVYARANTAYKFAIYFIVVCFRIKINNMFM